MNKYIIPVCNINKSEVYNLIIVATSYSDCEYKIMEKFSKYSEKMTIVNFLMIQIEMIFLLDKLLIQKNYEFKNWLRH